MIKLRHKKTFHPIPSDALSLPFAERLEEKCPQSLAIQELTRLLAREDLLWCRRTLVA